MAVMYLIWSIEHEAWWRAKSLGYTTVLAEAGRYTREEANTILATGGANRGSTVNECKIPVFAVENAAEERTAD